MGDTGITRRITIHIQQPEPAGRPSISVVPDRAQALPGDTVEWSVHGGPPGVVVTVGNFVQVQGAGNQARRQAFPEHSIKKTSATGQSCKIVDVQPGVYKYDVLFDGATAMDPELEILRPGNL